ncbi:hypothetical protein GGI19_001959 [Coemansia pectinata]|uniref:F-box domain-containing protein n=1 Tax=Coemansia pectinata TaxID=1052879 RepID=A0A9W8GY02_9FUNG|nr:hypothetical protein GGI19_001959 [Coemansia pectinata]
MQLQSPFQILPLHIVDRIVDYVAGSSRLRFKHVTKGYENYAMLLTPLLLTCPSLSSPALARIFWIYEMPLTNRPEGVRRMIHSMQHCVSDAGSPAHLYARELEIILTMLDVRSIKFKFLDPSALEQQAYNAIALPAIESNISAFVQRIKLIAPLAKKITISVSPLNSHEPLFPVQPFSDLVAQLS